MLDRLARAIAGDTIDLGDEPIPPFHLRGSVFDPPVTIRGGVFQCANDTARCFRFDACCGLSFEGGRVTGANRSAGAILVDRGSKIAFRGMRFEGLKHGIAHRGVDGLEISDCTFSDMRIDAIRGGGSSRVAILRNTATDFRPIDTGGAGDHPDFIQFWPLAGYTDNDDIVIADNVFTRGTGLPAQGIFVRGIYADRPRFGRVSVLRNLIDGGLRNGVCVSGAADGEVRENTILSHDDVTSFLRIEEFGGRVEGNCARHFVGDVPLETNRLGDPVPAARNPLEITLEPGQTLIVRSGASPLAALRHPPVEISH
ncbi:right-handed parallel beta-helix repeat-containing protein [Erythrobacter litoralis]|uniref:right-handed parallel beta-helix repeat-containing protein n=1 Tax=Erythrobacter litoralis TaxID=39960 RepID=UPI00243507B1|nr:right-handed parallel beta-helix repeat-containing protein [Erythrobacter litoralis]MDG6079102.1 right-handed parallel beta-helix repeat-containing protein [Erythrobacter litoralis]